MWRNEGRGERENWEIASRMKRIGGQKCGIPSSMRWSGACGWASLKRLPERMGAAHSEGRTGVLAQPIVGLPNRFEKKIYFFGRRLDVF